MKELTKPPRWSALAFALPVLALFGYYYMVAPDDGDQATGAQDDLSEIHVTAEIAAEIAAERQALTGRPPTPDELDELVKGFIDEEVLLREATARGIDCSGCNGRRHLVSRALFVLEGPPASPTEAKLEAFFAQHGEQYQIPERLSFDHAFFPERPSPEVLATAMAALEAGDDPEGVGSRFWMGNALRQITPDEIRTVMGTGFAERLFNLESSGWSGPHRSARGFHIVRIADKKPARSARFDEVRIRVEQDWERWQRVTARERLLAELRSSYSVKVDPLEGLL